MAMRSSVVTTIGLQMRAAAADFRAARLLGVRADTVISFAFVLAGLGIFSNFFGLFGGQP